MNRPVNVCNRRTFQKKTYSSFFLIYLKFPFSVIHSLQGILLALAMMQMVTFADPCKYQNQLFCAAKFIVLSSNSFLIPNFE
jgi:hypothetical protein